MKYPLLKGRDNHFYPKSGKKCSLCGESFRKDGIVYLAGGAVADCLLVDDKHMDAFFKIHYHTAAVDCSGNASVEVIQHLQGGQFELLFCSTPCLRKFLMEMVNKLEVAITKAAKG